MVRGCTWWRAGVPFLVLAAQGCQTLPDTSGYTSATIEVRQSAAAAGDLVRSEIEGAAATLDDPASRQVAQAAADSFRQAWGVTLASLDATILYAQSIQDIADAGNSGADSARKVAESVSALAGGLGVTVGPAGAAVTDTGAFVYGEIAKIRAARSLAAALAAAGPSVMRLQALVEAQVGSARRTFLLSLAAETRAVDKESAYGVYPSRDGELVAEEKTRLSQLTDLVLRHPDDTAEIDATKARLKVIGDTRAALAPGLAQYQVRIDAIAERRRAGLAVLAATDTALAAWASAHQRLVEAVRDRRPVTAASLTVAVSDLRAVIQTWSNL